MLNDESMCDMLRGMAVHGTVDFETFHTGLIRGKFS
jgi:hypothetical protein